MRCVIYRESPGEPEQVDCGQADGGLAAVLDSLKRVGEREFCRVNLDGSRIP
ncbi:hypothetical protein [Streptomyces sp. NPDC002788]